MKSPPSWLQALPMGGVFLLFFALPLLLIVAVSFWPQNEYTLEPGFTLDNYTTLFSGCGSTDELCVTVKTYLSTLKFCFLVWLVTLVLGFTLAYFVAFHVPSLAAQTVLFTILTIPFWTSNVIRMISWIPLLGRNGLVNDTLRALGLIRAPIEGLLYSDFAVVLAFVHLDTVFMIVPIFNSLARIDRRLIEAARDCGASGAQILWTVILPLAKPGIAIGTIFVTTLVMGDFVTVGVMGGQQIASVGKVIQVQMAYLQFPAAAANAMVLLAAVLLMILGLTRMIDLRREL